MEQEVSDIVLFVGRFHPLILHLPIGFLMMAFILEILSRTKRFESYGAATGFVLLLGSISAAVAAFLGFLLAQAGGYNEQMLAIHKWSGIGVAVLSGGAYGFKRWHEKEASVVVDQAYLSLLSAMMVALAVAGHYGGSLTHGSDYLTQYMPNELRVIVGMSPREQQGFKEIRNLKEAVVYDDIIDPILETRCTSCHNESKKKGELQMHTRDLLLKGGEGGAILVEGNAEESEMIKRIHLPEQHDDHMPPEGKRQLTDEYKQLLAWWIDSGAPFEKKVADIEVSEQIQSALNTLVDPQANMNPAEKLLASDVEPVDDQQLASLRQHEILVQPISSKSNWLHVDIPKDHSGDSLIIDLTVIGQQVVWLDLGGTVTSDTTLKKMNQFPNLTRLYLQNTGITDIGLQHLAGLSNLEYLNLYGTAITDKGIQELAALTNLRKLFVWQTKVTQEGSAQLVEALPAVEINLGFRDTTTVAGVRN